MKTCSLSIFHDLLPNISSKSATKVGLGLGLNVRARVRNIVIWGLSKNSGPFTEDLPKSPFNVEDIAEILFPYYFLATLNLFYILS